jgi:hypothetical protein
MVTYRNIQPLDILDIIQTVEAISGIRLPPSSLEFKENAVQERESFDVIRVTIREGCFIGYLVQCIKENDENGDIESEEVDAKGRKVIKGGLSQYCVPSARCVEIMFEIIIEEEDTDKELTSQYLLDMNFLPSRRWDEKLNQFRLVYEIEGYDCDILISPHPNTIEELTPENQIEMDLASIPFLESHHTGDWNVYAGSLNTHIATFHYWEEVQSLLLLFNIHPLLKGKEY